MKNALDLLDLALAFKQQEPLRADAFRAECKRRGVVIEPAQLELLHQVGVLVPLYRVARDTRAMRRQMRAGWHPEETPAAHVLGDLPGERERRRVHDPHAEDFRPWHHYDRVMGAYPPMEGDTEERPLRVASSVFLYSPYHVLLLPLAAPLLAKMVLTGRGNARRYRLRPADMPHPRVITRADATRDLIIALTALEARYRPEILGTFTERVGFSFEDWLTYSRTFDAAGMLAWLGWAAQRVQNQAMSLLYHAHDSDPLGDFHEIVRLADTSTWATLRGDALQALDGRIAAEMLLRFYEDLIPAIGVSPLPVGSRFDWSPLDERIRRDRRHLDRTLTEFGLSPYPALVLVLEGETEYEVMMPRVMDLLGIPRSPTTILLANARGANRDLGLFASYIATPLLGEAQGHVQFLKRRLTRFLVAVDPDRGLRTPQEREQKRVEWVQRIIDTLPASRRDQRIGAQIDRLVHIESWDGDVFELAHFTDEELVNGIQQANRRLRPADPPHRVSVADIGRCRAGYNLRGIMPPGVTKVDLADELWPVLERKIVAAQATSGTLDTIPIVRVALKAWNLAQIALRQRAIDLCP